MKKFFYLSMILTVMLFIMPSCGKNSNESITPIPLESFTEQTSPPATLQPVTTPMPSMIPEESNLVEITLDPNSPNLTEESTVTETKTSNPSTEKASSTSKSSSKNNDKKSSSQNNDQDIPEEVDIVESIPEEGA